MNEMICIWIMRSEYVNEKTIINVSNNNDVEWKIDMNLNSMQIKMKPKWYDNEN